MRTSGEVIKVLNILRKNLPLSSKVILRRIPLSDQGWCCPAEDEDDPIEIIIDRRLSNEFQIEVLIHEYAHAVVMCRTKRVGDLHDSKWGIAYAEVYRCVLKYYIENRKNEKVRSNLRSTRRTSTDSKV